MLPYWEFLASQFKVSEKCRAVFRTRAVSEGISFLTKTLPALGKDLDRFLINGDVFEVTAQFKTDPEGYPLFLGKEFRLIVDGVRTGDVGLITCKHIKIVRQLTMMYYKLEVPFDEGTMEAAVEDFVTRDRLLAANPTTEEVDQCRKLLGRLLCNLDPFEIIPRHGSGATACKTRNEDKYSSFRFIPKLDAVYPYADHFLFNYNHLGESGLQDLIGSEVCENTPSRLVAVPKDSRGPRLICCEPREHQYLQQGLMISLYQYIEAHPFTKGWVNFTDQRINQELARESSVTGEYATLDLSEASDRVSMDVIRRVFPPRWVIALETLRTTHVELPDGTIYGPLRKHAPMGSALCFPVEALLFWSIIKASLHVDVWVYGDDIILPTNLAVKAVEKLHSFGLKVNTAKSCYKTHFRESCGLDAYNGYDIGYVKYRSAEDPRSISRRQSDISFCQGILDAFGREMLGVVDIADVTVGLVPRARSFRSSDVIAIGEHADNPGLRVRWNRRFQKMETKIKTTVTKSVIRGGSYYELLRLAAVAWRNPVREIDAPPTRAGVYNTTTKVRWKWTELY
jgi:hypothetical protein